MTSRMNSKIARKMPMPVKGAARATVSQKVPLVARYCHAPDPTYWPVLSSLPRQIGWPLAPYQQSRLTTATIVDVVCPSTRKDDDERLGRQEVMVVPAGRLMVKRRRRDGCASPAAQHSTAPRLCSTDGQTDGQLWVVRAHNAIVGLPLPVATPMQTAPRLQQSV